ncbi:hypothetical protein KQ940_16175 [Marinobacterium sp. D7]|uniref:hypothetical protein n=1 Tax=Marinobacterium ramblicola TaxID=2849041 RepID=UPI001C2CDEC5|nr:hypothetical protein [Marinobacterium ramblicola]MBV1789592.1 hypothetical protein [Marinobacterium ramblicola]
MRDLRIQASRWQSQPLPAEAANGGFPTPVPPASLLDYSICRSTDFLYHRLGLDVDGEPYWYLYALSLTGAPTLWVLGVFDTAGQVDFFLALHSDNPLKVPALRQFEAGPGWLQLNTAGQIHYPHYAGVYQVGLKSYRVVPVAAEPGLFSASYSDRDHVDYLGQASEKEICLLVYGHFDSRLRGCKLC